MTIEYELACLAVPREQPPQHAAVPGGARCKPRCVQGHPPRVSDHSPHDVLRRAGAGQGLVSGEWGWGRIVTHLSHTGEGVEALPVCNTRVSRFQDRNVWVRVACSLSHLGHPSQSSEI